MVNHTETWIRLNSRFSDKSVTSVHIEYEAAMGVSVSQEMTTVSSEEPRKPKLLCLHGFRTSGRILSMQMSAFRYNTEIDCSFMDGPHPCRGEPDTGIAMVYPNETYFEWYNNTETVHEIEISIQAIIAYMVEHGPYDGILGFSQGAAMATRIAHLQSNKDKRLAKVRPLKFFVLIGGVNPSEYAISVSYYFCNYCSHYYIKIRRQI